MCPGASHAKAAGTSKTRDKATGKSKAAAKEKEREKQLEAAEAQFNMAMPHWTLRIVSDADAAVSLFVGLKTKFATISIKIFTIHCAQKEDQRFHCTRTGKHIGLISISLFQVVTRKKSCH